LGIIEEMLRPSSLIVEITQDASFKGFTMTVDRPALDGSISAAFAAFDPGIQEMAY
jgi:hypothetical protein